MRPPPLRLTKQRCSLRDPEADAPCDSKDVLPRAKIPGCRAAIDARVAPAKRQRHARAKMPQKIGPARDRKAPMLQEAVDDEIFEGDPVLGDDRRESSCCSSGTLWSRRGSAIPSRPRLRSGHGAADYIARRCSFEGGPAFWRPQREVTACKQRLTAGSAQTVAQLHRFARGLPHGRREGRVSQPFPDILRAAPAAASDRGTSQTKMAAIADRH